MRVKIGEFALSTGLTVKALRHYDEVGLLRPSDVNERTGYRSYGTEQLRPAARIRALRDAGMSLGQIEVALNSPQQMPQMLSELERERAAAREAEDATFASARVVLDRLDNPVPIIERRCAPQPYIGVVVNPDAFDDEAANAVFAELWGHLAGLGIRPDSAWWTTLREGAGTNHIEMVLCWPTPELLAEAPVVSQGTVELGVLPERTEIVATIKQDDTMSDSATAASITLVEYADAAGYEVPSTQVRQIGVLDEAGLPIAIELVLTVGDASQP